LGKKLFSSALDQTSRCADLFLEGKGTAYKSFVGSGVVYAGFEDNLEEWEIKYFGKVKYIRGK
jgi:hypothetical protein